MEERCRTQGQGDRRRLWPTVIAAISVFVAGLIAGPSIVARDGTAASLWVLTSVAIPRLDP